MCPDFEECEISPGFGKLSHRALDWLCAPTLKSVKSARASAGSATGLWTEYCCAFEGIETTQMSPQLSSRKSGCAASMAVITGVDGKYDKFKGKYEPPMQFKNWLEVVQKLELCLWIHLSPGFLLI